MQQTFFHFHPLLEGQGQVLKTHNTQAQHISCTHQHRYVSRGLNPLIEIMLRYPMQLKSIHTPGISDWKDLERKGSKHRPMLIETLPASKKGGHCMMFRVGSDI